MMAPDPRGVVPFGPMLLDGRRFAVRRVWWWKVRGLAVAHGNRVMVARPMVGSWRRLWALPAVLWSRLRPEIALLRQDAPEHPDEAAFEPGRGWGSVPPVAPEHRSATS